MEQDRMVGLVNRLRKCTDLTMQRESQNSLSIGDVIGKQFFLALQTNARVEALLELLSDKINKDAYNKAFCDKLEQMVEGFQEALGVSIDNDGKLLMTRVH